MKLPTIGREDVEQLKKHDTGRHGLTAFSVPRPTFQFELRGQNKSASKIVVDVNVPGSRRSIASTLRVGCACQEAYGRLQLSPEGSQLAATCHLH